MGKGREGRGGSCPHLLRSVSQGYRKKERRKKKRREKREANERLPP